MAFSNTIASPPLLAFPIKGYGQRQSKATTSVVPTRSASKPPASVDTVTTLSAELKERIFAIKNIRKMTQVERAELLEGSIVAVVVDDKVVDTLPFRLFLAISTKAREWYQAEGRIISKFVASKQIDKASVKMLIHYIKETSAKKTCSDEKAKFK